jgi:hypothetical protein
MRITSMFLTPRYGFPSPPLTVVLLYFVRNALG